MLNHKRIQKLLTPIKQEEVPLPEPEPEAPKTLADEVFGSQLIAELKDKYNKSVERDRQIQKHLDGKTVAWRPHAGPQEDFLKSTEYEVLFCGGRASGKSDTLIADTTRFIDHPQFRGLIVRRTIPALEEIVARATLIYKTIDPGVRYKVQDRMFIFSSGARIEIGYFDHLNDYNRYHGRQFNWVGIDEISQFESKEYYDLIKSVARSTADNLPVRVRATTNPSGPGRTWIKEYFIDAAPNNTPVTTYLETPIGRIKIARKYIKSTIFDNPTILEKDPQYLAYLSTLPEVKRRQWLEGDFDAADGLAFEDFHKDIHVCEPFDIPSNWVKFRAIDWGFRSKAVCLWFAINQDNQIYVYRQYVTTGVTADIFAQNILALEAKERISYGVIDGAVGVQSGINGPTIEEEMVNEGLVNIYADKSKGSRIHGKNLIHKYLKVDSITQEPTLKIFNTVTQLTKELGSLMISKNDPEDINTHMEDHAYDALRYGLMSRPDPTSSDDFNSSFNDLPVMVNSTYGY